MSTCVDLCEGADFFVGEESLAHGSRIGHAGRLDDDPVEPVRPLLQFLEYVDQVSPHGATHASVYHVDDDFRILELRREFAH